VGFCGVGLLRGAFGWGSKIVYESEKCLGVPTYLMLNGAGMPRPVVLASKRGACSYPQPSRQEKAPTAADSRRSRRVSTSRHGTHAYALAHRCAGMPGSCKWACSRPRMLSSRGAIRCARCNVRCLTPYRHACVTNVPVQ